jgi:hypothetical protein
MRATILIQALFLTSLLPACTQEEEPVANRFERQKAEIENKAAALESQVENDVSAAEARLQNEADALTRNQVETNSAEANTAAVAR